MIQISEEKLECLRWHLDQAYKIIEEATGLQGVNKPPARSSKKKARETYIKGIINKKGKAGKPPFIN